MQVLSLLLHQGFIGQLLVQQDRDIAGDGTVELVELDEESFKTVTTLVVKSWKI